MAKSPWNYPGIVVCEGRYYYGMVMLAFQKMPGHPHGGDLIGMLWRFDNDPRWIWTYRFRYYASAKNGAWDGQDKKSWYVMRTPAALPEVEMVEKINQFLSTAAFSGLILGGRPIPPDWFLIQGGVDKAMEALEKTPKSWFHQRKL